MSVRPGLSYFQVIRQNHRHDNYVFGCNQQDEVRDFSVRFWKALKKVEHYRIWEKMKHYVKSKSKSLVKWSVMTE